MNPALAALWTSGGKCVLLGDAVTLTAERRGGFVARLREQVRSVYPDAGVELIVSARAGSRVPDLAEQLDGEVLPLQPKIVVALLGVTDVWYASRGNATPVVEYRAAVERMVSRCREAGVTLLLGTPMLIGERVHGGNSFDEPLANCARIVREVAAAAKVGVVDLHARMREELKRSNPSDRAHGILTIDGIHPNDQGARLIANGLAEALGFDASRGGQRQLRHVVLFKYDSSVSVERIGQVEERFRATALEIPGVMGFECGTDNSPEGLSGGFTHAYIVTFADETARDQYLPHPRHQQFVNEVKPLLSQVLVVDFWADIPGEG
ncbi:MAG: Dabb family protein [Planctomycetales bacterium]|nr:Dabb family protein [Planctomycetales bacterium]